MSHDNELKAGWRHLAAVRKRGWLGLFVDGKPGAGSAAGSSEPLDLTDDEPLRIGFGTHDHFKGSLSGLRLYGRALKAGEITGLATKGRGVLGK